MLQTVPASTGTVHVFRERMFTDEVLARERTSFGMHTLHAVLNL